MVEDKNIFKGFGPYHTLDGLYKEINNLQKKHSNIMQIKTIGKSVKENPILAIKITSSKKKVPKILYTAVFHSIELIGAETVLGIIKEITSGYKKDNYITYIVSERELWFVPVVNPDGYKNIVDRLKISKLASARRNANKVDLNRNFSTGYWRKLINPLGGLYSGKHPFSEPETKALKSLVEEGNFKGAIAFHSYGNIIYFPYFYSFKKTKDNDLFIEIAKGMRERQKYEKYSILRGALWGFHFGDFIDWLYKEYKVLAFLFEIGKLRFDLNQIGRYISPFAHFNPLHIKTAVENNIAPSLYLAEVAPKYKIKGM